MLAQIELEKTKKVKLNNYEKALLLWTTLQEMQRDNLNDSKPFYMQWNPGTKYHFNSWAYRTKMEKILLKDARSNFTKSTLLRRRYINYSLAELFPCSKYTNTQRIAINRALKRLKVNGFLKVRLGDKKTKTTGIKLTQTGIDEVDKILERSGLGFHQTDNKECFLDILRQLVHDYQD